MKIAFCLEMLYLDLPFPQRVQAAKRDGIRTLEIWDWHDKNLDALKNQLLELGMTICNMSGNRQFGMADPADYERFLQELRETGEVARKLGCPTLMLLAQPLLADDSGKPVNAKLTDRDIMAAIVMAAQGAGKMADELDINIVIEPLNDVLDHHGFFLNTSQKAFQIIRNVNHPRVRLLYDIYHMAMMNEDCLSDITHNIDLIGHVHIADKPGRHEPGSGALDFKAIQALLQSLNYQGVIGFEFTPSRGDSHHAIKSTLRMFQSQ
jgi:hydroxypyruvate isomerase